MRQSAWLDSALTVVGQCCNGVEQSGEATCVARLSTDSSGTQCCNGVEQSGKGAYLRGEAQHLLDYLLSVGRTLEKQLHNGGQQL